MGSWYTERGTWVTVSVILLVPWLESPTWPSKRWEQPLPNWPPLGTKKLASLLIDPFSPNEFTCYPKYPPDLINAEGGRRVWWLRAWTFGHKSG